jgi:hypothetical protein
MKTVHVMTMSQMIGELQQCSASEVVTRSDFVLGGALWASCLSFQGENH